MIIKNRKGILAVILTAGMLLTVGCRSTQTGPKESGETAVKEEVDAVSSASQVFYQESSLDQQQLWSAIAERKGSCTIATVNEDGTPNLIVAVPATAGDEHVYFTWADNVSKANVKRTGQAMVCYYIYDAEAESKTKRNIGARMKLELESDKDVLEKLAEGDPTVNAGIVFKVTEILPLG